MAVRSGEGHVDELPYDQLVVALGSTSRTLPIPGLAEHGLGFKTISEAIALRNRLISTLERAEICDDPEKRRALLTYVFVGAGYAGLEGIAELQDFARDVVERYPRCRMEGMRFILVEARDRVMPEISRLAGRVRVLRAAPARHRDPHRYHARRRRGGQRQALDSDERLPCRTVCWTAGVKPVPVVAELGLPLDEGAHQGRPHAAASRASTACGRSATPPRSPTPRARPGLPADRPARAAPGLAGGQEHRRACWPGTGRSRSRYKTLGVFVDMGRYQAVAETLGIRWRGFPAWFLARTYHLAQMPGYKRRLRITVDWTVDLFFGRDSSELGQLGHPPRLGEDASGAKRPASPARHSRTARGPAARTHAPAGDGAVDADDAAA